ncbi:ABC-2 type transport system permease protein [Tamaricihabitans halophyticus]|uniref:Transport permease protein n=1 Tax=Tamaricihabitans halophyticus TaxID=1262583 RepID=A0A4R2QIM6_9PSEU|nr:ABC transporter permease [Tamaricihabitans halophyticus]TCP48534.1 ABC-2 type transport system permease protein [Tamaricihabitans halophyticus]
MTNSGVVADQSALHPREWRGSSIGTQLRVLTGRSLRALVNEPRLVVLSLLQPLIMLLLFSQVFSGIAQTSAFPPGVQYIDYLMPAILMTSGLGAALQSGIGLVTDMKNGVLGRFRSLPIQQWSVLFARSAADLIRTAVQLLILLGFAIVLFGFSPAGGFVGIAAAFGLALIVSWALSWVFLAVGAWLRNAETMQQVGFLAMFPLMFASSAYVPLEGLPGWLRAVATVNPLTYAVDAARNLALAMPVGGGVLGAVATSAGLLAIGVFAAVRGFRRPL